MLATTTTRTARQRSSTASGVSSASCACGDTSLIATQNSASPPASLRYGSVISVATMPVNRMSSIAATPAPNTMPQKRSRGGSARQASAITTALSPDKRMLMPMIWTAASQNVGRNNSEARTPPVSPW